MKRIISLFIVFIAFAVPVFAEQPLSFTDSDLQRYKKRGDAVAEPSSAEQEGQAGTQPPATAPQEESTQEVPQGEAQGETGSPAGEEPPPGR